MPIRIFHSGLNKAVECPCCGDVKLWGRWSDLGEVHSTMPRKCSDQSGRHELTDAVPFLPYLKISHMKAGRIRHLLRSVYLEVISSSSQRHCAYGESSWSLSSPAASVHKTLPSLPTRLSFRQMKDRHRLSLQTLDHRLSRLQS
jgi:hypothetical protein